MNPKILASRVSFTLAVLVVALAVATPAMAAFCYWKYVGPPQYFVLICTNFVKLTATPECLEPIDEEDVILCPPGAAPPDPFNSIVGPSDTSDPVQAFVIAFEHPDPANPDDVAAVAEGPPGWAVREITAAAWDSGDFEFANAAGWSPPGLGTFAETFGAGVDHAFVFLAEEVGAAPIAPGTHESLTLYGLNVPTATYPYLMLGDGVVVGSGQASFFGSPVSNADAAWGDLKALYR